MQLVALRFVSWIAGLPLLALGVFWAPLWTDHNRLDPVLVAGSGKALNDYKSISVKHWFKNDQHQARYQALRHAFLSDAPEYSNLVPAKPKWMNPIISLCLHQDAMAFLGQELAKPWSGNTVILSHHAPSRHSLTFAGYFSSVEQADLRKSFDRQLKPHKIGAYSRCQ